MSISQDPLQHAPLTVLEELAAQDVAFLDDRIYEFNDDPEGYQEIFMRKRLSALP